jgi:hypothetical protein
LRYSPLQLQKVFWRLAAVGQSRFDVRRSTYFDVPRENLPWAWVFLTNTQNSGFGSSLLLNTNLMSGTTPRYVYKIGNNFPSGLNDDDALPLSDLDKVRCIIAGLVGIGTDYAID